MTLKEGKTGMTLKIKQIDDSSLKERLMTMGLTPAGSSAGRPNRYQRPFV